SRGDLNPGTRIKLVWGVLQSSIAAVLLLSGGLAALQTASVIAALPFAVILIGMCFALHRALSRDHDIERKRAPDRLRRLEKLIDGLETNDREPPTLSRRPSF